MARTEKPVSALSRFIDNRYIPMGPRAKLVIGSLLLALPVIIYIAFFSLPHFTEREELAKQNMALASQLTGLRAKANRLQQLENELADSKKLFDSKAALLPESEEIPKLLKDISALGTAAGLDFLSFKPMPAVPKDFYAEIPIAISLKGTYHSIGHFFDSVSKLERIVAVGDLKMGNPTRENNEMILKADCQLLTYRYSNEGIAKPQTPAGSSTKE